jgi:serine protease Do
MKKYFVFIAGVATLTFLLNTSTVAQEREKTRRTDEEKEKVKEEKEKYKTNGENEEIIIHKKGDGNSKVTIEIRDDEVLVNGKPLEEFDDENISIRKGKSMTYGSPFRGQAETWNMAEGNTFFSENKAFLGVNTDESENGAKILSVTDESAAEKAGLKEGDVITKIGDKKIASPEDLTKVIGKYKPDEKVTVTYERDGKQNNVTAKLGKRKGFVFNGNMNINPHVEALPRINDMNFNFDNGEFGQVFAYGGKGRIGIKAQDTEDGKGAKVLDVDDSSPAEKAGIDKDDIIIEFDGKDINSADDLASAAREARDKTSMKVKIRRDGKTETTEIKIPKKLKTANL